MNREFLAILVLFGVLGGCTVPHGVLAQTVQPTAPVSSVSGHALHSNDGN